MKPINLEDKFSAVKGYWHPHRIGIVNDMHVLLAKAKGEFIWHSHKEEDELFQVIKGTLYMQFRDKTEVVREGELIIVPKGVPHCPATKNGEEVHILLFEKQVTAHTGTIKHEITQTEYPII